MNIFNSQNYKQQLQNLSNVFTKKSGSFFITGGTGLIGSFFVDLLIYSNQYCGTQYKIFVLSRKLETLKKRFPYADNNVEFIEQDINNLNIDSFCFDYIIHTAGIADPALYITQPVEIILGNINGINSLLEYCKKHLSTRLVFTSTFEVNGIIENTSVYSETDLGVIPLNQIRSSYPLSKKCCESLLLSYVSEYNINAIIVRLPSVYGPTMKLDDHKAHSQFLINAINGENIVLKSKGLQRRTYTYVYDVVKGILTVLEKGKTGEIYNIANDKSIVSIYELANIIADISEVAVMYADASESENKAYSKPHDIILDNKKILEIGCNFEYSIEDGIKATIEILKQLKDEI